MSPIAGALPPPSLVPGTVAACEEAIGRAETRLILLRAELADPAATEPDRAVAARMAAAVLGRLVALRDRRRALLEEECRD